MSRPDPSAASQAVVRSESPADTRVTGPRLALARVAWVVWAGLALGLAFAAIRANYEQLGTLAPAALFPGWTAEAMRAGLADLGLSAGSLAAYTLALNLAFVLACFAIAAVILWRRSDERMALFATLFLMTFAANWVTVAARMPATWAVGLKILDWIAWVSLICFFFLFPDGRFVPRWTRGLAIGWMVFGLGESVLSLVWPPPPQWVSLIGFSSLLGSAAFAQVYRYRRASSPVQRQQTKWIVFGFTATFLAFLGLILLQEFFPVLREPGRAGLLFHLAGETLGHILFLPIPLSIAIAMLRYRLWDIDLLINRALVYGALTGALAALYVGGVVLVQGAFRALTGQESDVAIVAATLAVAALFQPLRSRLQAVIDRRFYRRRYDAARVLAAYGAALRDNADLEALSGGLRRAADETMRPAHVSLWLREADGRE
jgi:hypothetical protein